jgi:catenin alpha
MTKLTRNLRRQLRKAVIDHISDTFLETSLPLKYLIEAAKHGDENKLEENAKIFADHAEKLVEVSSMACSMSNDTEGIKLVRMAALQIQQLTPQVVNAARVLCARTQSKVAQENMDVFRDAWEKNVRLLTDAVDDIINIHDFLSVSENHILEDINRCVMLLREHDVDGLDSTAGAIRCRTARVCNVVSSEMDNYEPCDFTAKVLETVSMLRDKIIPNFAQSVEYAVNTLSAKPIRDLDENAFIDASRLVYDGVRDVRNAVLLMREGDFDESDSDIDGDTEFEDPLVDNSQAISKPDKPEQVKQDFANLPLEERTQIQHHWDNFRQEKRNFDREVLKWDDKGNDIIALAKQMCVIMMEMTDFTRGKGPLKTTMDIINAAKKISECGNKLDKLAKNIADECPESQSKRDLLAYLEQIPLFCNQLNIASKVKENVIDVSGEPIITGLDSATSLIISGKNLMNAVVSVVKASYVASTKYTSKTGAKKPIVQWRMKAPEKKPLVITAKPQDAAAKIKKSAQKKKVEPIRELNEFDQ